MKSTAWISLAAVLVLAACGGSQSSSTTPPGDDDDDDGPQPTSTADPQPTATAAPVTRCFIEWAAEGSTEEKIHLYVVDLPIEEFTTGTKTFGDEIVGVFLYDLDETDNIAAEVYAAEGTFDLTVAGTSVGDAVTFQDDSAQQYRDDANTQTADGGVGSFDGTIVDLNAQTEPAYGTGTVEIDYGGSTRSIGDLGSLAGCAEVTER